MSQMDCRSYNVRLLRCKCVVSRRCFEMYGTVASGRRMHSASPCCISPGAFELILTTLNAEPVYLLVNMKVLLIGWLQHVYPLLGFAINTSYTLVLLGR